MAKSRDVNLAKLKAGRRVLPVMIHCTCITSSTNQKGCDKAAVIQAAGSLCKGVSH